MAELKAVIKTTKGTINLNLFADKVPYTVANFVNLAQRGYYDGLVFHRVISDFMVQGGCPNGDGRGGPGYMFADEFDSSLTHDGPGVLSMANSGPNTNGSQFFITHVETPWLNGKHAVFGKILGSKDQTVVDAITQDDEIENITIEGDTDPLFSTTKDKVSEWDGILDQKYTRK